VSPATAVAPILTDSSERVEASDLQVADFALAKRTATLRRPARIRAKIEQYAADPASLANNVKRLRGGNEMRLRVGDWRVIFREDGVVLAIIRIAPRSEAYD